MNRKELISFAENYSSLNFDKIKFDWNGKHADEFRDPNYEFRMELCLAIKDNLENYSLELIKDMYTEVFACAKESWGIPTWASSIAQTLLEKGGITMFETYMKGAIGSMDTGLASGNITLSKSRATELYEHIKKISAYSPENAKKYELMELRFRRLSEKN